MKFPETPLDLLIVAPHPDDAEISVGGTILKSIAQGKRVGVLELTNGEPTPYGSIEKRQAETEQASEVLGITWRGNLGLPNRSLESNLASRRALAGAFRQLRPEIILAPYWDDAHPDHVAASALVDAARFWSKLSRSDIPGVPYHPPKVYYFWSIHLRIRPEPSFVLDISGHLEKKMQAIRCYESQFGHRSEEFPTILDDIEARARYWGWSIGTAYGEPFASKETVGVSGFDDVL